MTAPGQADEYTPTEDEVRRDYAGNPSYPLLGGQPRNKVAEFDRFLAGYFTPQAVAEIRHQVREAALEEAASIVEANRWETTDDTAAAIRAAANQTGD